LLRAREPHLDDTPPSRAARQPAGRTGGGQRRPPCASTASIPKPCRS
jgi:hypothetical protein